MDLRGWDPGDQRVTRDNQRVDLHHYEGSWRGLKQTGVSTKRDRVNFGGNLRINGNIWRARSLESSQLIGSAMSVERNPKRLKISGPHFDNTGLIDEVQFDFEEEEDIDEVLRMQLFHLDYWMLSLVRWQSRKEQPYPSEIIFWVKVLGFPLEFWAAPTFERIGEALGEWLEVDLDHGRIKVKVDGYKRLCFETSVDFRGGEFHDREEALISLRYEKRRLITSLCRISVSSLLFVGSLVLVSFYPKFMNWNKDGLVGFYICCVVALLRRNFMCLGAYWCNLCFTGIYKSTGLYLVCWNILASLFIMKQILYLVSLNQVQLQSRCCELQCANWFQGDCRLSSSKIQDKGFTFFQIFSVIKGLTSSLNLDWAVRYSTVSLAIWRLPRQSQVRILDLEKNYVLELLNVKVFTELTECDFKVISRVGKENRTSGGILILVLNKVGLCLLHKLWGYCSVGTGFEDIL
ncbi:hypothetical protein BRARA_F01208 [Brassica rapa]|uniref:Uncharacterized protein n=1 Tax=Brassica campestris TaxID=3711 RepID=A0A397Z6D7_BRACM|nr:hypothetical protein BRARA_F01208 [Brassica rapa]